MYRRFLLMIATSTALMYALTYANVDDVDDVFFSQTRLWMALLMGSAMSLVMLAFMRQMYGDGRKNVAVVVGAVVVGLVGLAGARSQRTVGDVAYMKAMIPHHSIAVLTSERARIKDPRVRALADGIRDTQVREIAEMRHLIDALVAAPPPSEAPRLLPPPAPRVSSR